MRRLLWFAVGFAVSCAVCVYGLAGDLEEVFPAAALGLCAGLFFLRRRHIMLRILCALLLGASFGGFWYQIYEDSYLQSAAKLDGITQEAVITASDYGFETGYGIGADGIITLEGKPYQVRAYLDTEDPILPGTRIRGDFRFRLTTPDAQKGGTSHSGKGIFLLAYQEGEITLQEAGEQTFLMKASILRRQIRDILARCIPEDAFGFAQALLLGDTTALSYETDTVLKVSGIRHVAAVSGLHISILFALVTAVTFRNRFLSALLGLPALLVFAAVAGFTPSVTRACIMCALMLLSLLVSREYDGLTALATAAVIMLAANPLIITSGSFQLSAASVLGIFLFTDRIGVWLRGVLGTPKGNGLPARAKRMLITSVSTTLGAMVFTTPLCALPYGTVSLIGVVTNLLVLWLISGIFYCLMAVVALSGLFGEAALLLGTVSGWLIRIVLTVASLMAKIPFGCVYTASAYIVLWLIFVYLLLAVFLLHPNRKASDLLLAGLLSLCAAIGCSCAEPMFYSTSMTVLDVGQGQCILLQSEGRNYLVDCGGEDDGAAADAAAELLLSQGITRLDGLIVTHSDRDHAGGVAYLLSRVDTDLLILPTDPIPLEPGTTQTLWADRQIHLEWGSSKMTVFGENIPQSPNENSLCILLDTEKYDILITGDRNEAGELRLLETGNLSKVDVLVAGHHGSRYANSEPLLQAAEPETVCISVGAGNIYGHPHPQAIERLEARGCDIYRTDIHGTITVRR